MEIVLLTALGVGGATVIGAVLGFTFKKVSHRFSDIVLAFAAGVMLAAAVIGLILPSLEYGGFCGLPVTVIGILCGYDDPADHAGKSAHYARLQQLAAQFREKNGSIICRDLLGLGSGADHPVPEHRTEAYYKKRPCADMVADAAEITEQYLREIGKLP